MGTVAYIALGILLAGLFVVLATGVLSRRQSLPCPVGLRWLVELDNPFTRINHADVIIQHLDLEPGMTVLDVGCGPGRLTIPIARDVGPAGEVTALDLQEGMLQRAREKARLASLNNIRFVHCGVGEGKLETNRYDRALLVTVLGEIPDQGAALEEIFAALKPGGILSVTEVVFDPHFQRRRTVRQLAANAGFSETAFYGSRIAYTMHFQKHDVPRGQNI